MPTSGADDQAWRPDCRCGHSELEHAVPYGAQVYWDAGVHNVPGFDRADAPCLVCGCPSMREQHGPRAPRRSSDRPGHIDVA